MTTSTLSYLPQSQCHRASSQSSSSTNMSNNSKRLSITGSIKGLLSRKSSTSSQKSTDSQRGRSATSNNPFAGPVQDSSRSPLANRSGPTRRPIKEAPPPSYNDAVNGGAVAGPSAFPTRQREVSPSPSGASAITVASVSTPDDPYAFLGTFDTIFLIDDSGSMAGASWREVKNVLANITPICTAHDSDGIDVFFLNHRSSDAGNRSEGRAGSGYNITDDEQVEKLFENVSPTAATPTGTRIRNILMPYLRNYEKKVKACDDPDGTGIKPVNMIVITDGAPTDDLEGVLGPIGEKLDELEAPPYQIGIQFFQVGSDPKASRHLAELDDNLKHKGRRVRDFIDTVSWNATDGDRPCLTADAILKTVLGAVVKRLDRRAVEAVQEQSSSRGFLSIF